MTMIAFSALDSFTFTLLSRLGLSSSDARVMTDIYISTTKRGVGHHDIHNLPQRLERLVSRDLNPAPEFRRLSAFGGLERYDGDNAPGELIVHCAMARAMALAAVHGMGLCAVRNSNHYLCSAPYVEQAARAGYIGLIIAKAMPTMGVPGHQGNLIGQSPMGFAFPAGELDPAMLDICLAYVSFEKLRMMAENGEPVPAHWGVGPDGQPTTDAKALLKGTKYPIGEHKGFGLALLCELLTGVLSGGCILDEPEEPGGIREMSHTAIAIKVDALMPMEEFEKRSEALLTRLKARDRDVHIPGEASFKKTRGYEASGEIELEEALIRQLNAFAEKVGMEEKL